jgi:two-component system nitrogen regulation response regulator GlnG
MRENAPVADFSTGSSGKECSDNETLEALAESGGSAVARVPCLTVLYAANLHRIGERLVAPDLFQGGTIEVSRNTPAFTQPQSETAEPLNDPYLSRHPLQIKGRWPHGLEISPGGGRVVINGEKLEKTRRFELSELRAGISIELARRVVLLLHLASERPGGARAPRFGLVGDSDAIEVVRQEIARVADLDVPVLIRGETGVGKERVAQGIHGASKRAHEPCVAVNMAAIAPATAVSELFGHARGAFTGASNRHAGFFERADGGTLFLDEIGETAANIQPMLLRALETGTVQPVGADAERAVDVRIIAATDVDLERAGEEGSFRTALLHRLAGFEIVVPSLRERVDDIPRLVVHFLREELEHVGEVERMTAATGDKPWFPASLMVRLVGCDWPGNVRQLRNAVRQLVISSRGAEVVSANRAVESLLAAETVPPRVVEPTEADASPSQRPDVSEAALLAALRAHGWARGPAAAALGIPRSTLYYLIDKCPAIRKANEIPADELERVRAECDGNLYVMAERLCVSKRGLTLRLKGLGRQ